MSIRVGQFESSFFGNFIIIIFFYLSTFLNLPPPPPPPPLLKFSFGFFFIKFIKKKNVYLNLRTKFLKIRAMHRR